MRTSADVVAMDPSTIAGRPTKWIPTIEYRPVNHLLYYIRHPEPWPRLPPFLPLILNDVVQTVHKDPKIATAENFELLLEELLLKEEEAEGSRQYWELKQLLASKRIPPVRKIVAFGCCTMEGWELHGHHHD